MTAQTAADHRAAAAQHRQDAADSWERSDTDGFVSQWASGVLAREADRKAEIAENGGRAKFPALFDLDGNLVAAKLFDGTYGATWGLLSDDDPRSRFTGYVSAYCARKSTHTRKGYTEGYVLAPARVKVGGSGRGLAGALSVSVYAERTDGGFSRDVEIVTTCREYDKN